MKYAIYNFKHNKINPSDPILNSVRTLKEIIRDKDPREKHEYKIIAIADYSDSFTISFRIAKRTFFTINYGAVKSNSLPYFSTTAEYLTFSGRDYKQCGQAQDELLTGSARDVWEKWGSKHLSYLTMEELLELLADIENLKEQYPWIENDRIKTQHELDREITQKERGNRTI